LLSGPSAYGKPLPPDLKGRIENLSGVSMSDVRVHYNSMTPARLSALAHTHANDIHLASGQESHLAHEAWHAVQQRQGRVRPTHLLNKTIPINESAELEREADRMGSKALGMKAGPLRSTPITQGVNHSGVVQRKKVGTGFGDFETTKFEPADDTNGKGVNIELSFQASKTKVDAKKIALIQSLKTTTPGGTPVFLGVSKKSRLVPAGKPGEGYAIDAPVGTNNPIYYNTKNLGAKEELKDTPDLPQSADSSDVLLTANYQLGFCYKEKPKDKDKDKKSGPAKLLDKPRTHKKGQSQTFETAALAIDGPDKNKYLGSVKWGYKLEEEKGVLKVVSDDISLASPAKGKKVGTPTENFVEAAKMWNAAEVQGTLRLLTDMKVKKIGTSEVVELSKGTKVKELASGLAGETPAFQAEVLDGKNVGAKVGLRHSDVEDLGSGVANKQLPIP
jgi:hypothetical protein